MLESHLPTLVEEHGIRVPNMKENQFSVALIFILDHNLLFNHLSKDFNTSSVFKLIEVRRKSHASSALVHRGKDSLLDRDSQVASKAIKSVLQEQTQ